MRTKRAFALAGIATDSEGSGRRGASALAWLRPDPGLESTGSLRRLSLRIALLTALLGVVLVVHYRIEAERLQTEAASGERLNVGLARRALAADLAALGGDLAFLARRTEQLGAGAQGDREALAALYGSFAEGKGLYDQIRLLNASGRELVRVDYAAGRSAAVPQATLQDKSSRYYVAQALALEAGQIYVSPLDLNVERGRLETPWQPTMRVAERLHPEPGAEPMLLVLNYQGRRLLERFREVTANIGDHVMLLNSQGQWLSSPRPGEAWTFMRGQDAGFAGRFPDLWQQLQARGEGQLTAPQGLLTFTSVAPAGEVAGGAGEVRSAKDHAGRWWVVALLTPDRLAPGAAAFLGRHAPPYLAGYGLLLLLTFLLGRAEARRRTAELQRAYEVRFRQAMEDTDLAVVMLDPRGRVLFCNAALAALIDRPAEEIIGRHWVEHFLPPAHRQRARRLLPRLLRAGGMPRRIESDLLTRRGEVRRLAWHALLARDSGGGLRHVAAIGEDVTERRRAEDKVQQLSRAVEQSPAIVIITDPQGAIEYVNVRFTEVTGYAFDEVRGRNPRLLQSGHTPPQRYRELWSTVLAGGLWRGVFHNRRKNGEPYWESATVSALRDARGRITHFLAVKEDITERRRLQQALQERDRKLARAQTLAEVGRMANMIAHDLRSPLSSVQMFLQLLLRHPPDARLAELGRISLDQVAQMESILEDVLAYSRPDPGRQEWLTADHLLPTVAATVQRQVADQGVNLRVEDAKGLPSFPGDPVRLRQMLANLVVNGAQAAAAARAASARHVCLSAGLELGPAGTAIRLEVRDNGAGIPAAMAEQVFEPFFTTRARGTGLGLAIVRQIVDQHGGRITLESGPDGGTRAVVLLPTAPAAGALGRTDSRPEALGEEP